MEESLIAEFKPARLKTMAEQVAKKQDSYAKISYLQKYLEYKQEIPFLWQLHKLGYLALEKEFLLWSDLAENEYRPPVELFINLISKIQNFEFGDWNLHYASSPLWPAGLDQLACYYYPKHPEAFQEALPTLSEPIQEALKTVMVRCGQKVKWKVKIAEKLAYQQLFDYGIGTRVGSARGKEMMVWWPDKNSEDQVSVCQLETGFPNELFYQYIQLFCSLEEYEAALLTQADQDKYMRLNWPQCYDLMRIAPTEKLFDYYKCISHSKSEELLKFILDELRKDTQENWVPALSKMKKENAYDTKKFREQIAVGLMQNNQINQTQFLEHLNFKSFDLPLLSDNPFHFKSVESFLETLNKVNTENLKKHIDQINDAYHMQRATVAFHLIKDKKWWDQKFEKVYEGATEFNLNFTGSDTASIIYGFAKIAEVDFNYVYNKFKKQTEANKKDLLRSALILYLYFKPEAEDSNVPIELITCNQWSEAEKNGAFTWQNQFIFIRGVFKKLSDYQKNAIIQKDCKDPSSASGRIISYIGTLDSQINDSTKSLLTQTITEHYNSFKFDYRNLIEETIKKDPKAWLSFIKESIHQGASKRLIQCYKSAYDAKKVDKIIKKVEESKGKKPKKKNKAEELKELCEEFFKENPKADSTIMYVFLKEKTENSYNQTGGNSKGIAKKDYPSFQNEPMTHVLTLDLSNLPILAKRFDNDIQTLSLFISDLDHNQAFEPYNAETHTIASKKSDLKKKPTKGDFKAYEVKVPTIVFYQTDDRDRELSDAEEDIRSFIYQLHAWYGPYPIWLQYPEPGNKFIMQFDEAFVSMNLGDSGVFYWFDDTGFWQCH